MRKYTKEELNETLKKLPEPVQEVVLSPDTIVLVEEIGSKHSLHVDQKGVFGTELSLMLMGLRSPQEFGHVLKTDGRMSEETSKQIISDVNNKIFIPLRNKMEEEGISPVTTIHKEETLLSSTQTPSINPFADEIATPKEEEPVREEAPVNIPVEEPVEEKKIEKKYAIDPYREPIE